MNADDYNNSGSYTGNALRVYLHDRLQDDRDELQRVGQHAETRVLAGEQPDVEHSRLVERLGQELDVRNEILTAIDQAASVYGLKGTDKPIVKRVLRSLAQPYRNRDDFLPWLDD